MIQSLSSIKLAFYIVIAVIALLAVGIVLNLTFPDGFRLMNDTEIEEWIHTMWSRQPLLVIWFALLCTVSGLLFVNALLCTLTRQVRAALKQPKPDRWLLAGIHLLFITVLFCHGLILMAESQKNNVKLFPGEAIQFAQRYRIELTDVAFAADVSLLTSDPKTKREMWTRENFRRKKNTAGITLYKGPEKVATKDVFMLSPLRYGPVQVTVTRFMVRGNNGDGPVGVVLSVSRNHLNPLFFAVYGAMILALGIYTGLYYRMLPFDAAQTLPGQNTIRAHLDSP